MDRLIKGFNLGVRTFYLIFILSMLLGCSAEKKFQFVSFEKFISGRELYPDIEETHFLYIDTALYSQLVIAQNNNNPLELAKYNIHANDIFILDSEYQYEDVTELLRKIPAEVYDFFYGTFGFSRESMNIGRYVLIHDNKAYIEVHNNGTHVGLVISLLPDKRVSLGIAYVLTS